MTSIPPAPAGPGTAAAVTVAVIGRAVPTVERLRAALATLPTGETANWQLLPADDVLPGTCVDIVVCDGPAAVRTARRRWPRAELLAVLSPDGDESTVLRALDAGAQVCVRGSHSSLVAAYVHSIARRRGLLSRRAAS